MPEDSPAHHRRSIRLKGYDYTLAGAYFVTLVTWRRECLFGRIVEGEMRRNELGEIVAKTGLERPIVRPIVELDAFVVMPNHAHGVIVITDDGGASRRLAPTDDCPNIDGHKYLHGAVSGSLGAILGQIKSLSTKRINAFRQTPGNPVWQRNFYERIIRNEREMEAICAYIDANPRSWGEDELNRLLCGPGPSL